MTVEVATPGASRDPRALAVRARGLHVTIGETSVLAGLDIDLPFGAVTAITGENGAGKSTLLEVLAGTRPAASGTIERAAPLALVVQRLAAPEALPLTVRDVVGLGTWRRKLPRGVAPIALAPTTSAPAAPTSITRVRRRERVDAAIECLDLRQLADRPFASLSGGQRQRTLIAQALAGRARILLLDEPATGLDAAHRESTARILAARAATGVAVACVTHDAEAIAAADHVVHIHRGVAD